MKFVATKFGEVDFEENEIIVLPKGILGFSQLTRYILLDKERSGPFKWLQSVEDPNVAFVIADPLNFTNSKDLATYVIVTVPQDASLASADLLGPLVINPKRNLAKQAVMSNSPYTTKHYLLDEVKKRLRRNRLNKREPA